ncbi:metallophosphoesterase [Thermococcus aggregans]|uniref:Metallophosphoesterase n=1 Tax=Thermococcus aggregans TaxID=110163 RepID=A0A9E7MY37_THEAG|nr:metallophosphoesterase [Thermococcus aggregans]USS40937.1 metallophosphoesterase [Thermococcus aggregans]
MRLDLPSFLRKRSLPKELLESGEAKIMHISDTPDNIYPFILNLIEKSRPDYIIHTGDLVDNIKLERRPELKERYAKKVRELLDILENSGAEVYIVPGNEDSEEVLKKLVRKSRIVEPGKIIRINNLKLALAHDPIQLNPPKDVDFILHGHSFRTLPRGLNGLLNVNFILLGSKKVIKVRYPDGTNFERGYKLMRGL